MKNITKVFWYVIGIIAPILWMVILFSKEQDIFRLVSIGTVWIISVIETKECDNQ